MIPPYVEDLVVIRRRIRVTGDGRAEEQLVMWATTKDEDYVLAMLEKCKWKIGHHDWSQEPDMKVEGLTEPATQDT